MTFNPHPKKKPIRLHGNAYKKFRIEVYKRHNGICEGCGNYAPLTINGVFDLYNCGHVAHIISRGAGGGDTHDNTEWKCYDCHNNKEHGPRWSSGRCETRT